MPPILVVGHPRSGTSLVAGALVRCGAQGNPYITGHKSNPGGFYENTQLSQLVRVALKWAGYDPLGVSSLPPRDVESQRALRGKLRITRTEVEDVLKCAGYDLAKPWLWKNAKLLLFWDLLLSWWPDATVIHVHRQADEIVRSCMRTDFMRHHFAQWDGPEQERCWSRSIVEYWWRAREMCQAASSSAIVDASKLVQGDTLGLEAACVAAGLRWEPDKVSEWVRKEWWHG